METNLELNIEDESNLAKDQLEALKLYLKEIEKIPLLTPKQERELVLKIQEGDEEAKKKLVEGNLRLVVNIAKRYLNRGLEFLDLIQEGNLGLIKAAENYDINKCPKFSTYAGSIIEHNIYKAIADKGRNIRLKSHKYEEVQNYKISVNILSRQLNRTPTREEVAQKMSIPVSRVSELEKLQMDTISLNYITSDDYEANKEIEKFIPLNEITPEDIAIKETLSEQIYKLFKDCNLKKQEIEVLLLRFGFNNNPMTQEEVGKIFGLTRNRISQLPT